MFTVKMIIVDVVILALLTYGVIKFLQHNDRKDEK